ncbi:MAG: hypothetical protein PHD32_07770, partial [Eubacteriales bacterium]|nr:hypothetical protein [Eubacteriales bacterium]
VNFGYWNETLEKWAGEGHIPAEYARAWADGNAVDDDLCRRLGFDFNWSNTFGFAASLYPRFERRVLSEDARGYRHVQDENGVVVLEKPGVVSIPAEIDHLLKDRASWEEHYKPRLQYCTGRINREALAALPPPEARAKPLGLMCGSLFGEIRNMLGVQGASYLYADDEELFTEIINTVGDLCFRGTQELLASGATFDFAHFWEDICFKNGPLIIPRVFAEKVGPHYRRITALLQAHNIDIVSLDCDGCIDALLPIWLENGVNTMFPIEVGTWGGSLAPWREKYGRQLRGVGGMDKRVFAADRAAVDAEIERLKPLVALGGFLPCPDHRIAPDAKWDLVCYYTQRMHDLFA